MFKSRLQEYAQKASIPTPVYDTTRDGPSHEPTFRSSVTVNNIRYDSLPGFFNRKAAEQSAAEVALLEVLKSSNMGECLTPPVHETGLCKNLLQEYAQKMNYAIPSYSSIKTNGKMSYTCTVDVGGIQYIGTAARTKREAEIKAARTALLAIQSNPGSPGTKPNGGYQYTVVPIKKKGAEERSEPVNHLKPKKAKFKKWSKKKSLRKKEDQSKLNNGEGIDNTEDMSGAHFEDAGMLEPRNDSEDGIQVGEIMYLNELGNAGDAESSGVQVGSHSAHMEESKVNGISEAQFKNLGQESNGGSQGQLIVPPVVSQSEP
ncbi:Double-stranded RNA-binding protein 8 [Acorus calamus]|uniref:Double-stranded RNA-binding protein 8 n=1 Tax=Acorus calamus TaxID=4465 RepID=A0AAV9DF80_ACOCL|nr:Double-stranded RNA-binding protein 8 [Acorus calamus]